MKTPPKTLPLLLEVGCEDIPAGLLTNAQEGLAERVGAALKEARLLPQGTRREPSLDSYSTPRRLVVHIPAVLENQPDTVEEVMGPPATLAFDEVGKPTRAAESFARRNGVGLQELVRVSTPKGEHLAVRKTTRGRLARELLSEILPDVITRLSFPKSMYWVAKGGPRFVRPIRWILAMLGRGKSARIVNFEIAGVRSDDLTYPHWMLGHGAIRVSSFEDYAKKLRRSFVEIDARERRRRVRKECEVLLEKSKLAVVEDRELEEWIANSTEWPRALLGEFDPRFLKLPREILVTVMRGHQKDFAVEDRKGGLQPGFVAVMNLDADPKGVVRRGHERVLAARFRDAEFFWAADQRVGLQDRILLLKKVVYQAELGSYAEKGARMMSLAKKICELAEEKGVKLDAESALSAVKLSKCDLTTKMVQEFPELQGIVGGLYARAQGEPVVVADAIYDQYRPLSMEDRSPRTIEGAVVSLADKIDSIAGGFAVGLEPTGSSDPFALRRKGNGVIKVLLEHSLPIELRPLLERALVQLKVDWKKSQGEVFSLLAAFLEERLAYYLEPVRKLPFDTVRAVLSAGWDPPLDSLARAEALQTIRGSANFEALTAAAKRIKNILAKSASAADWSPGEVEVSLLKERPETDLYHRYMSTEAKSSSLAQAGDYAKAFELIGGLRSEIDLFFDKVLVMAEDPALRQNRLRLLAKLDGLFSGIAQFTEVRSGGKG